MTDQPTTECRGCLQFVPDAELNAEDLCEVCQTLAKLRETLTQQGKMKPEQQASLPYKD